MKRIAILFFATVLGILSATAQQTDSSQQLEFSHLFHNSRGTSLYELNAYNSSGSTVYLFIYDTYTGALPGAASTANTDWNTTTGVVTTEESHLSWGTGTRITFSSGAPSSDNLINGGQYYLIQLTGSTFKIARTLDDAIAGRALTLVGFNDAVAAYILTVKPEPLPPIAVPTKSTACVSFQGRRFSDGIQAVFSTTDTSYTAASAVGLFDANYR